MRSRGPSGHEPALGKKHTTMEFNLAQAHEAIAEAMPDRECVIHRDQRFSWADVTDRTRRLANFLLSRGLGTVRPRSELSDWQTG